MYNNFYSELYHYGTELYHWRPKGSKNGVRRWTNPDGTLNAAGKERYANMYGNGKVGSGYTQARAAANKQRNSMNSQVALRSAPSTFANSHKNRINTMRSMNSQAALRMAPVSSSYVTDHKRTAANPIKARRSLAVKAGEESAARRQAEISRSKVANNLRSQLNSMNSQSRTASPKERHRVDSRKTNLSNQLKSMNKQANIQRQKAVEAGRRGESEGIAKQKRKNAEARRIKIQKDKQQHAEERERLNREQFRRDIDNTIRAQNEINLEKKRRSRRR